MTLGTNKIIVWKNNLNYLEIGELNDNKISLTLSTGISSVDKFNEDMLNFIKSYELNGFYPKVYDMFDIIENEDITAFVISQLKYRRCTVYLVIQTSAIGYRYLSYFYDKVYHNATSFGTSYKLVSKDKIINCFENILNEIENKIDINKYPRLKDPIFNRNYKDNFGIY